MRILHIGKYYPPVPGGMERFLGDLVDVQRRMGHDVAVLVHDVPEVKSQDDPPWLIRCPVWFRLVFAPISPAFPFRMHRLIDKFKPEILHFHTPNPSAFWALLLPAARRLPWVIQWQSDVEPSRFRWSLRLLYPFYHIFERALLERTNAIIATSPQYLSSSVPLMDWRDKCHVIPLGLLPERLSEMPASAGEGLWQGAKLRVLSIGRLTYYKGFETLIRAVAGSPDVELIIVGEGEERTRLEQLLANEGNPSEIRLFGQADDELCQRLLASCDLFCLPSRERTEAFGIVLMEAMRYGKPLLASNIPGSGVTWLVRDGENGVLVTPEAVSAWRSAITVLENNPERRIAMGEAGRRRFVEEFDIGRTATQTGRVYRSAKCTDLNYDPVSDVQIEIPAIVIPALNEEVSVGNVIALIRTQGFQAIYVIDDGSTDNTAKVAESAGATVLRTVLPQGAWGAMQTGIRLAVRAGHSGVVTLDADGQHEPAYIHRLLDAGAKADVVIGAYPERGSYSRRVAWSWFRRLTGFGYEDLTSGFRYYNADACRVLASEEATLLDYQDIGVLLLLRRSGMRIIEVPVVMNSRNDGGSRIFSSWWTVVRYLVETTLLCLVRWGYSHSIQDRRRP